MITQLYQAIKNNEDTRKNLIELRKLLKDAYNQRAFWYEIEGDCTDLCALLDHQDPKVRKNAVLILGELKEDSLVPAIYKAYEKEGTLFVKSDYVKALSYLDCTPIKDQLKERLAVLTASPIAIEEKKHKEEEIRILSSVLVKLEVPTKHLFTGYQVPSDLILVTNRDHQNITKEQITKGQSKVFGAGVLVRTTDLKEIIGIRTYTELLFKLPAVGTVANDPVAAAATLWEGGILAFLQERHEGAAPFYFRMELKTKEALDKKALFAKKIAAELERLSDRALINDTSHYECEIRLIANKNGEWNVLLKLYTLADKRFSYRKNTVAASIAPATAALVAQLAKPYLKAHADVLDPFCGVGTMLVEREQVVAANHLYGVDLYGEAIDGAIENTDLAAVDMYLITKDFFLFEHKYLFDEIYTNMPTASGRKTQEEMATLYDRFFNRAHQMLVADGTMVLYTRDPQLVDLGVRKYKGLVVEALFEISKKENAYVYILKTV